MPPCIFVLLYSWNIWAVTWENVPSGMCAQRRLKSTCACAQSDYSLHCPSLRNFAFLDIQNATKDSDQTARMISLTESSLSEHIFQSTFSDVAIHSDYVRTGKWTDFHQDVDLDGVACSYFFRLLYCQIIIALPKFLIDKYKKNESYWFIVTVPASVWNLLQVVKSIRTLDKKLH